MHDEEQGPGVAPAPRGMAKMEEVYGFSVDPDRSPGPYVDFTVDHLFGAVWTRPELDIRDRRLMTIGVLAALGQSPAGGDPVPVALSSGASSPRTRSARRCSTWPTTSAGRCRPGSTRWPSGSSPRRRRGGAGRERSTDRRRVRRRSRPMVRFDFTGKVAIVTGSGGGIGQAYAEALADAGAVGDGGRHRRGQGGRGGRRIRAAGGTAESVRVDVADPESARAMADAAVERFGGIDYLVNNAAIFGGMQLDLLLTVDWEYLNRFLSVNMLGALNCVRACYPAMKARGGGAIVNQSSTAAYLYAGFYGLAKAGVNSLTQQLAHELGGQHIRTNAIAPGPIDTEASRTVVPDAFMKPILAGLALKRQGQTSDLVGMCLFLLSDEASWITGHVFNVDGGQVVRP